MFDSLTYQKGSALLRMLQQFLGEETFRQGVGDYLRAHAYGNTETHDLWSALEKASGQPVGAMMNSWIFQGGFPEVEISHSPEGDGLLIEQRRFAYLPDVTGGEWHVPIVIRFSDGATEETSTAIVGATPEEVRANGPVEWAVANAGGNGFYRVRYTPELMDSLVNRLDQLDPLERYTLLDDTWAHVKAGRVASGTYLDLAARYGDETEAAIWGLLSGSLGRLRRIVQPESLPAFEGWVRRLLEPAAERLGWEPAEGEDDLTRKLRGTLLRTLGTTGRQGNARERARGVVDRLLESPESVDPDVAVAAIYVTASAGTEDDYQRFYERYKNATDPQEEGRFMYALPEFEHRDLTEKTFQMTLDGRIRTSNGPMVIGQLLANATSGDRAWELIKDNWDVIIERFPPMILKRAVETIWTRHDEADDIRAFLATHEVPSSEKAVAQALERLDVAEGLAKRESNRLTGYLQRASRIATRPHASGLCRGGIPPGGGAAFPPGRHPSRRGASHPPLKTTETGGGGFRSAGGPRPNTPRVTTILLRMDVALADRFFALMSLAALAGTLGIVAAHLRGPVLPRCGALERPTQRRLRGLDLLDRLPHRARLDARQPLLLRDRRVPAVFALLVPAHRHVPAGRDHGHRRVQTGHQDPGLCAAVDGDRRRPRSLPVHHRLHPRRRDPRLLPGCVLHGALHLGIRVRRLPAHVVYRV